MEEEKDQDKKKKKKAENREKRRPLTRWHTSTSISISRRHRAHEVYRAGKVHSIVHVSSTCVHTVYMWREETCTRGCAGLDNSSGTMSAGGAKSAKLQIGSRQSP